MIKLLNVIFAKPVSEEGEIMIATDTGYAKRVLTLDYIPQNRGGKGAKTMNFSGSGANGNYIAGVCYIKDAKDIVFELKNKETEKQNGIKPVANNVYKK